jgi:DNA (cytosine-5)-methyltransferase 1
MKNSFITITDQFCGAGGSSHGARDLANEIGGGLEIKLALNHWSLAIETHNTNFPDTLHDCTDISACDPRRYPSTHILITSPECTNHSLAKGQKRKWKEQIELFGKATIDPTEERSRATMWDVPRFAEFHLYEIIIVENVVDARYWVMWDAWLKSMHCLGYDHKCVYYNSMHAHPTPQSRDRMYIIFWKKGNKAPDLELRPKGYCHHCEKDTDTFQAWKKPGINWGKYKTQYVYRCPSCTQIVEPYYYSAFNCIDWTLPGTRIGDRKKPLSDNTMKRIEYGINKYWNEPSIITTRYSSGIECRVKSAMNGVLPTQPGDQSHALFNPIIVKRNHTTSPGSLVKDSIADPLPTQLTDNGFHILSPIMTVSGYPPLITSKEYDLKKQRVKDGSKEPLYTQSTHQNIGVVMPFIAINNGKSKTRLINKELPCLTTRDRMGLLTPKALQSFLSYYYNGSNVTSNMCEPTRTLSTRDRASLVTDVKSPCIEDCNYRMLLPHEIKSGMAFHGDYKVLGNSRDQVKQLGNAVTPPVMKELLKRCIATLQ